MKYPFSIGLSSFTTGALLALALLLAGCLQFGNGLHGSGHLATENRTVGAFSRIELDGSTDLEVTIDPSASLSVSGDDNLLPILETKVDGDTLHVRATQSYSSNLGLKVKVAIPTLEAVNMTGSGDVKVNGLAADKFSLSIAGSGDAKLAGKVAQADLSISGSGDIQARDLATQNLTIVINGSGDANVHATESLNANINGSGDLRYSGNPAKVNKSVNGSGSIRSE